MSTLQPKGEKIRQAIRWISEELSERNASDINALIQEASLKFNLSPKDEEFLVSFYKDREEG